MRRHLTRAPLCCASSTRRCGTPRSSLTPLRTVSGGVGRGELNTMNPLSTTRNRRQHGVFRGLTHSSQSTDIQSGQLQVRKRILQATRHAAHSGSGRLQPDVVRWSFLLDSLQRGAESAVPADLYQQLVSGAASGTAACNDPAVTRALERGQAWFRTYELSRRLPLLEDSLAEAELHELMRWPGLLRRVWIRLPPTSPDMAGGEPPRLSLGSSTHRASPVGHVDAGVVLAPPHREQAADTAADARLRRLNDAVYLAVAHDVQCQQRSQAHARSRRAEAAWQLQWQTWVEDTTWHTAREGAT